MLGVIGLLAGLAVFVSRDDTPSTETPATAPVAIAGTALPRFGPAPDPALGASAPILRGVGFHGDPITIPSPGRPTAIVFLAHWCPHCQNEVRAVQKWLNANGAPAGVDLVSVATLTDRRQPNYPPADWLRREGWSLPVLVDDERSSGSTSYGLSGTPFWVFVDGQGEVVLRTSGELGTARLAQILVRLAAGS